jgi:hypothetical protein
VGKLTPA